MAIKKDRIFKVVVLILLAAYIVMSCFPCVYITQTQKIDGEIILTHTTENGFSIWMVLFLVLQIGLIYLDRPVLQLCAGLCGVFFSARILLESFCQELIYEIMKNIQYFQGFIIAPNAGRIEHQYTVTRLGQLQFLFTLVLVATDICLAVVMDKGKKAMKQAETSKDRDEVTQ